MMKLRGKKQSRKHNQKNLDLGVSWHSRSTTPSTLLAHHLSSFMTAISDSKLTYFQNDTKARGN